MSKSPEQLAYVQYITDMMQCIGPVCYKRMFGGFGLFLDDLMFAIVTDDILYFKVDSQSIKEYEKLDLAPFTYLKNGKPCKLNYYQAPEETLDDIEQMRYWANMAFNTAVSAKK